MYEDIEMTARAKHEWHIGGMDCASCVAKVTKAVERVPGVSGVEVNLIAERLRFDLAPDGTADAVEAQVTALGYGVTRQAPAATRRALHRHAHEGGDHGHGETKLRLVFVLGALVAAAYAASHALPAWADYLYLGATLLALIPFGRRAIALARAGSPFSIETLMCVAAIGAVIIGAAAESAIVVLLFAVGEWLEGVAAGRARASIRSLVAMMPREAQRRAPGGNYETIDAEALRTGDIVRVRPGERVPCDGEIVEGVSALDESPVTGESVPVARGPGEAVVAGSVNANAALVLQVTTAGPDSTLARIARMVQEAAVSRGQTQRFIERFSAIWTPAAMALAFAVATLPPLLGDGDWTTWIYRGLAVLLVACPCALVISVPAAMASGLSAGARNGLLIKGGAALEAIGRAATIAFDKTGTLTQGRPRVTDIIPVAGITEAGLLSFAAAVEAGSTHPLARAVVAAAQAKGVAVPEAHGAHAIPGKGVAARVDGTLIELGSPLWAAETSRELPDGIEALERDGKTVALIYRDGAALGRIALRDEPRNDAKEGIAGLRRLGPRTVMLTGDNPRTAAAIAAALGMDFKAQLTPAQKLSAIDTLKRQGGVAMVGDGINDAPALAAADVGIAMGGGTAAALEAADAAIVKDRVTGVADLVRLSRDTLANVKQNVAIAFGLKIVFLGTTIAGVTGLWPAILADTGATVLVTLNALRLLRWRPSA
jgi:Zn2+/Cd2+-exporting ATPase